FLGELDLDWRPRPNRALFHDRHASRTEVIVPFGRSRDDVEVSEGSERSATDGLAGETSAGDEAIGPSPGGRVAASQTTSDPSQAGAAR
ncbi:MAG TPA: hypothetical protein VH442_12420, partial [Micromonosporaceae bacterium]